MRWIPCEERLPSNFSEDETVLATTDVDGDRVIPMFAFDVKSFYLKGYISAWMPLPKPYKADRKTEHMMTKEIHDINTKALDFVAGLIEYIFEYPDDDYMTMECLCRELHKYGLIDEKDGEWTTNFIERKESE